MDYKRVLILHFTNGMSGREIAETMGDKKTTVNEFLKRFRECEELSYPLSEDVTNEFIAGCLYKKAGNPVNSDLYRDFDPEEVHRALAKKGETLKHLWKKYNVVGTVNGRKPLSYRQFCRRCSAIAIVLSIAALVQVGGVGQSAAEEPSDVQYVMYLGTNDKDTNQPVFTPEEAKENAERVLIDRFGGYTIQEANGGWIDDGTIYQEYTLVIYLSDTDSEQVHAAAAELIDVFNQSSVLMFGSGGNSHPAPEKLNQY